MSFIHDDFLLETQGRAAAVPHIRGASAHHRLPLPPAAERCRRGSPVREPVRDLARRRSLQVAGDARKRRRRAVLHRRRRPVRQVSGMGEDRAAVPAQSALSLDASRAEAVLRHRRSAERENGRQRVGAREREAEVAATEREGHPRQVLRQGRLHDRRSGRPADLPRDRLPPRGSPRRSIRRSAPIASWIRTSPTSSTRGSTSWRRPPTCTSRS